MTLQTYKVQGFFQGRRVDTIVEAYSPKQAKFNSAFKVGATGPLLGPYMKTKTIKIRRLK